MFAKFLVGVLVLGICGLVQNIQALQCIVCRSDNLEACATLQLTEGQSLPSQPCPENADACYTYVQGTVTSRGCQLPENNPPPENATSACSTDRCNANVFPENRIQCHKCTGDGCYGASELNSAVPCVAYKEDDQCYTHLLNDVVTRGCLSESSPEMQSACEDELLCSKCTESSCNGKSIEDEYCIVCDSESDANCVSNLNDTMQQKCPTSAAGMGCFKFDDGGDIVHRGCVSSLLSYEVDECRREGQFCKTCIGNNCNAKVDFETCRSCNSENDVNCIRSPGSVSEVVCRNYLDSCVVHVENNVVTRGCLLEQTPSIQAQCSFTNNDICETCTGTNNCNNKIIDGEFCMECDSQTEPNCRSNLNHTMRIQCNLGVRQIGCYLFDDGGDIVKRGCVNNDLHPGEVTMCRQQGANCKTCYGNDCNAKVSFQRCRSCDSQNNVNCIRSGGSVAEITCRDYMDTCYVHVRDDIVTRGCVAQPTTPTAVQTECRRTNSDFCETCAGNNCNNILIDGEFCLTCDSQLDANCRDSLNHTMRTQCNLGVRQLGCYRFDDGGDIIKRGCLSHLIPEEISMCRQQGQFCKTCIGDDCNSKIDFQECKVCNSSQNVDCIRSTHYIDSSVCRNYLDECFVHVDNNLILRGCLQQNPALATDCRNPDICEACDDRGNCNDQIVDGEFCITCDSQLDPNCINNVNVSMRTQCSLGVSRMGCYLFDDGGGIVKRGCVNDLIPEEISMCRQQGQFCKTCMGNDCNTQLEFQKCYSCDSATNPGCTTLDATTTTSTCRNYIDTCITFFEDNRVIRGCSSQNSDLQLACSNNTTLCSICDTGNNCNNQLIEAEFCITCDSEIDSNCFSYPELSMTKQCGQNVRLNKNGCYRFDDSGDIVKRGCLEDLLPEEIQHCQRQNDCKTCTGNNCNLKIEFQSCYTCNSDEDINCVKAQNANSTTVCRNYIDECKTAVFLNGRTERGCASQLTATNQILSEVCETNKCNSNIFPQNRHSCHQCSGSQCNTDLSTSNEFMEICRNYNINEQCFSYVDSAGNMRRGCASDKTNNRDGCSQADRRCVMCGSIGCNSAAAASPSSLSCIKCLYSEPECAWGFESSKSSNCGSNVVFPDIESCYTYTHVDGTVTRGCTLENQALCTEDDQRCSTCAANGCNARNVVTQFCKVCRSDSTGQERCGAEEFDGLEERCSADVIEYENRGCYSKREDDDTIIRGCAVSLTFDEIDECKNDESGRCIYCSEDNCNDVLPSHSSALKSISALVGGLLLLAKLI